MQCQTINGYWLDWYECIELGRVRGQNLIDDPVRVSFSYHSGAHIMIGAFNMTGGISRSGDLCDVVTSPTEPVFMFHHANLERTKMWYMFNNYNKLSYFYGYPVKNATAGYIMKIIFQCHF